jgi:hypothetical protein
MIQRNLLPVSSLRRSLFYLKTEAAWFFETLIPIYLITRFHTPDDCNLLGMVHLVGDECPCVSTTCHYMITVMFLKPKTNRIGPGIAQSAQ